MHPGFLITEKCYRNRMIQRLEGFSYLKRLDLGGQYSLGRSRLRDCTDLF